jgi:hypothetical protein
MNAEDPKDSQLMNYVVRMVVPMRREFGLSLNVSEFMRDSRYAEEVLEQALQSQDPRLLDYARYVRQRLHGPRIASQPRTATAHGVAAETSTSTVAEAAATGAGASHSSPGPVVEPVSARVSASAAAQSAAEELRARVMKKYTGGLR